MDWKHESTHVIFPWLYIGGWGLFLNHLCCPRQTPGNTFTCLRPYADLSKVPQIDFHTPDGGYHVENTHKFSVVGKELRGT